MLPNVGWGEMFIVALVALVVLGPERLPEAARWLAGVIRKVKAFASEAQDQLKNDFGTDFEQIRQPLAEINQLRGLSPRSLVTKHLLDGDDSLFTDAFGAAAGGAAAATPPSAQAPARSPHEARQRENQHLAGRADSGAQSGAASNPSPAGPMNYDDAT